MILPYKKVTRIDIVQEIFEGLQKSECSLSDSSWDLVETERYSQSTWDGDDNHQILKANNDEAQKEAKNAYDKAKVTKQELRHYEDQRIEYFKTHKKE